MTFKLFLVYADFVAFGITFAILMGYFIYYGQWKYMLMSLFFSWACFGGFIIALIVGWQEAAKWQIKNLMRIYSVLLVFTFVFAGNIFVYNFMHPKEELTEKQKMKMREVGPVMKKAPNIELNVPKRKGGLRR